SPVIVAHGINATLRLDEVVHLSVVPRGVSRIPGVATATDGFGVERKRHLTWSHQHRRSWTGKVDLFWKSSDADVTHGVHRGTFGHVFRVVNARRQFVAGDADIRV